MKILQLTNKIPYPPKDGGAIATLSLSLNFVKQGHQVTVLGMNTFKHFVNLDQIPESISTKIKFEEVILDTSLSYWAATKNLLFSRKPYNGERFFSREYANKLSQLLQSNTYDVIQLEGLYLTYFIDVIRKYSNAIISFRAHNIEHEIWGRTALQEKSLLKKIYFKILARRIRNFKLSILNKYDVLVPITFRDAEKFSELGNNKPVCVIPAGFDNEKVLAEKPIVDFPSVFFIGTLDWFPNQEGVIWFIENVWDKILEKYPDLKFYIAGRNAPLWLKKLFDKKNILFLGEVDDAYSFMNQYAIMVVPLFSGSGMRVKIIEGMALGKTIITTNLGAEGIDIKPNENIVIEDDANGFINQLDYLIQNRELFNLIGQNASNFVKSHFDNEKITANLIRFYQKNQKP